MRIVRAQADSPHEQVAMRAVPYTREVHEPKAEGIGAWMEVRHGQEGNPQGNQLATQMNWFNFNIPDLRKPSFTSCDPSDIGIWFRLSCYCCGQENGGKIRDCRKWTDRQWLIACGVTIEEVSRQCALWSWSASCLVVAHYPISKEAEVQVKRAAGKATVKMRWQRGNVSKEPPEKRINGHAKNSSAHSSAISSARSSDDTEEERNRNGKE